MFCYISLKTLILLLICAGYSAQEPFGLNLFLKKPPQLPKPFQFLSLFGVYNENDDQEGLNQDERLASQSNKSFQNPGSFQNMTSTDQREKATVKANHPKLGLSKSQKVPGRRPFVRKPPVLQIQPSSLVDKIKQIFLDALQPFDTSRNKASNIELVDKSLNANQPVHKHSKTLEQSEFPENNKTYHSKNQEPEKDQQLLNFNDTFRNSKVSKDENASSNPFDRVFSPPNNETLFTSAPKVYSNKTESKETLDSPIVDLIMTPVFDVSEEFQEPERNESSSTNTILFNKSFIDQTNQPTFESYRMYQEPYKFTNETATSDQFDTLFQKSTNKPTLVFSKRTENVESSTSKIISNEKFNDFIIDLINQSIPELEKILYDQEISETRSTNNYMSKKSIDSDTKSQLLESDSSELISEFNTHETTSNDQFAKILHENNQLNSNISKTFQNQEFITNLTHRNDKPDLSNIYQTNQPTTNFNEAHGKFDSHKEITQKNDQHDSIPLETNHPNVNTDAPYENLEVASSTTASKNYIDQNSFTYTNQPTFSDILQVTEHDKETVQTDLFGQLHPDYNESNNDSSEVFRNSGVTTEATVSYDSLHQFTVPQNDQFFFDFHKVFQEPQTSTIFETNNDVYETATSLMPNLVETTFESDGEFQTSDIAIFKTVTNSSLEESIISEASQPEVEYLGAFQEPEESFVKTAKSFTEFISDEGNQRTTELDENFQEKYFSKTNAFSDGMFENSIIPQTAQTEIELTEAIQKLDSHLNEFTTLNNYDLKTDQSTFPSNKIFRNLHVPEVTENYYIETKEGSETSPGLFQLHKSTAESLYSTADVTGRETHDTTLTSDQLTVQLDTHKFFTDSVPLDFSINLPTKNSNTDFKEQKNLKSETFSYDPHNEHKFLYPLCSDGSDIRKLAPCDNGNNFFMCNDASSGTIKICNGTKTQNEIPLCFLDLPRGRYLVSCSASPTKMCLYESEVETAVRFCREPQAAICIDKRNKLQFCQAMRFKRQEPKVPHLDKDAYYAKCAKCKLLVVMGVEEDQRPVVRIRSEPYDPTNDKEEEDDNGGDGE